MISRKATLKSPKGQIEERTLNPDIDKSLRKSVSNVHYSTIQYFINRNAPVQPMHTPSLVTVLFKNGEAIAEQKENGALNTDR